MTEDGARPWMPPPSGHAGRRTADRAAADRAAAGQSVAGEPAAGRDRRRADDPIDRERRLALLVDHLARIPAEWAVRPVAGPFGAAELREVLTPYGERRADVFELRTSERGVRVLCLAPSATPDGPDPLPLDLNDLLRGLLAELAKTCFQAWAAVPLGTLFEPPIDLSRAVFYGVGLDHPIW